METIEITALMPGTSASGIDPYAVMPVPAWLGIDRNLPMQPGPKTLFNPPVSTKTGGGHFALFAVFATRLLPQLRLIVRRRLRGAPALIAAYLNGVGDSDRRCLSTTALYHDGDNPEKYLP